MRAHSRCSVLSSFSFSDHSHPSHAFHCCSFSAAVAVGQTQGAFTSHQATTHPGTQFLGLRLPSDPPLLSTHSMAHPHLVVCCTEHTETTDPQPAVAVLLSGQNRNSYTWYLMSFQGHLRRSSIPIFSCSLKVPSPLALWILPGHLWEGRGHQIRVGLVRERGQE